jgi:hypothetical protein
MTPVHRLTGLGPRGAAQEPPRPLDVRAPAHTSCAYSIQHLPHIEHTANSTESGGSAAGEGGGGDSNGGGGARRGGGASGAIGGSSGAVGGT